MESMVAFSQRPFCYQIGILLLMVATAVFTVGLAVPWWARTYSETGSQVIRHSGLWLGCSSSATGNCKPIQAPDWFKVVQGMQCVALIGLMAACVYAAFVNCCLDNLKFSRTVEILTGIAGSLGLISCILYVVKTSHVLRQNKQIGYSWAFGIDIGACVLIVFIAAIIALSNSRHQHQNEPRFIIHAAEDGYESYRSRPRGRKSRSRSGGANNDGTRAELALERSPVRTRRLGATSEADPEMIALQDGYTSGQEGQQQLLPRNGVCDVQPSGGAATLCACLFRNGGISAACGTPRCTVENFQPRPSSTGGQLSEHHYYHNQHLPYHLPHHSPCAAPAGGQESEQHPHHQLCKPDHHHQQQQEKHSQEKGETRALPEHQLCSLEHSHHYLNQHHHGDHQVGKSEHPHQQHHHHHHPFQHPQEKTLSCHRVIAPSGGDSSNDSQKAVVAADSCCRHPGVDNPGFAFSRATSAALEHQHHRHHHHHCGGQRNSDCDCGLSLVPVAAIAATTTTTAAKGKTKGPYTQLPMSDSPLPVPKHSALPPLTAYPGGEEERHTAVLPFPSCAGRGCACGVATPRVTLRAAEIDSQDSSAAADSDQVVASCKQSFADLLNYPRVTATAPPLEDDEEAAAAAVVAEDKDRSQEFSQTQYFMRSETVFIGERRGREQ